MNAKRDPVRQLQRQRIMALRELTQAAPVRMNHVPAWFDRRIKIRFPDLRGFFGRMAIAAVANRLRLGWMDRWGSSLHRGRPAFVAEPYGLDSCDLVSIDLLAKLLERACEIDARGWHYPGEVVRIAFFEKEHLGNQP